MVVEYIVATCPPELRDAFIQRDAEVWTRGLMNWPAFLGKEVWKDMDDPTKVVMVIHMRSYELWKAIPPSFCAELDAAMGDLLMPIKVSAYDVVAPDPRYQGDPA